MLLGDNFQPGEVSWYVFIDGVEGVETGVQARCPFLREQAQTNAKFPDEWHRMTL